MLENITINGKFYKAIQVYDAFGKYEDAYKRTLSVKEFETLFEMAEKVHDRFGYVGLKVEGQVLYLPVAGRISGLDGASHYGCGEVNIWLKDGGSEFKSTSGDIPRGLMAQIRDGERLWIAPECEDDLALYLFCY